MPRTSPAAAATALTAVESADGGPLSCVCAAAVSVSRLGVRWGSVGCGCAAETEGGAGCGGVCRPPLRLSATE